MFSFLQPQKAYFFATYSQHYCICPISLEKLKYEAFHGKVLYKTPKYNDYFKENFRIVDALDFIALARAHIPPEHKQLVLIYGSPYPN